VAVARAALAGLVPGSMASRQKARRKGPASAAAEMSGMQWAGSFEALPLTSMIKHAGRRALVVQIGWVLLGHELDAGPVQVRAAPLVQVQEPAGE
ncbi:unnamed protein product, partial [Amoebophrya sp. A120]